MLKHYKAQQKMLLDMIGQQKEAPQVRDESSKNGEFEDLSKKLPKPTLQKLTTTNNVEHIWATFEKISLQKSGLRRYGSTKKQGYSLEK